MSFYLQEVPRVVKSINGEMGREFQSAMTTKLRSWMTAAHVDMPNATEPAIKMVKM